MMKQNLGIAGKCLLWLLVLDIMSAFLYISLTVIAVGVGTKNIGYVAYTVDEDGKSEDLYTYYSADGEDTKLAEYEDKGIEVRTRSIRSQLGDGANAALKAITFALSMILLCAMVYSTLWTRGDRDNNLATFGHIERDRLRGLKIGLLADAPIAAVYILLIIEKFTGFYPGLLSVFRLITYFWEPAYSLFCGGAKTAAEISLPALLGVATVLLPVPAVAAFGYYCGNSEISIGERLIYVNKKKEKK